MSTYVIADDKYDPTMHTETMKRHRTDAAKTFARPTLVSAISSSHPVIVNPEHDPAANVHTGEFTYTLVTTWTEGPEPADEVA